MAFTVNTSTNGRCSLHGLSGFAVGAQERTDPIPPGIYWIDVIHEIAPNGVSKQENFQYWLQANNPPAAPRSRVQILKFSQYNELGVISKTEWSWDITWISAPGRSWILFRITEPVNRWGIDTGLGFPTIAESGANTNEQDTIQSPEIPVTTFWESMPAWGKVGLVLGGIGVIAWATGNLARLMGR